MLIPLLIPELVDNRRRLMQTLGATVSLWHQLGLSGEPKIVAFAGMSWVSNAEDKNVVPSEDPNHREALVVNTMHKDQVCVVLHREVITKGKTRVFAQKTQNVPVAAKDNHLLQEFFKSYDEMASRVVPGGVKMPNGQIVSSVAVADIINRNPQQVIETSLKAATAAALGMKFPEPEPKLCDDCGHVH